MASSSRLSQAESFFNAHHLSSTAMSYESFRPRFPRDPFMPTDSAVREPWAVDVDRLPSLPAVQKEQRVVLVLGRTCIDLFISPG